MKNTRTVKRIYRRGIKNSSPNIVPSEVTRLHARNRSGGNCEEHNCDRINDDGTVLGSRGVYVRIMYCYMCT